MACTCHQKDGVSVLVTKPDDQCTACARKHVRNAWTAWGEFCYEDTNRDYVSGQLRAAADHLKYDHRPEALHCRDLAALIEDVRDASPSVVSEQLCVLLDKVRELFYNDHPQSRQRLFELGAESAQHHAAVKRRAEALNFDKVIYVGENFGGVSRDEAKAQLFAYVRPGDSVLLKASHGMALNRLLEDGVSEHS